MNEIKTLKKEIKDLKFDLEMTKDENRVFEKQSGELKKMNREYADMLTEARDSTTDLKKLCDKEPPNNANFDYNIAIIVDELLSILNIKDVEQTINSEL